MQDTDFLTELKAWINGDLNKEAALISGAQIKTRSLSQLLAGTYRPSARMIASLRMVMAEHDRKNISQAV